jgi:hypothetical protein
MRSPSVTSAGANRKSNKPGRLAELQYPHGEIVSRVSVGNGLELFGHILGTNAGCYQAVSPNGLLIGFFRSRPEAAIALSEARS